MPDNRSYKPCGAAINHLVPLPTNFDENKHAKMLGKLRALKPTVVDRPEPAPKRGYAVVAATAVERLKQAILPAEVREVATMGQLPRLRCVTVVGDFDPIKAMQQLQKHHQMLICGAAERESGNSTIVYTMKGSNITRQQGYLIVEPKSVLSGNFKLYEQRYATPTWATDIILKHNPSAVSFTNTGKLRLSPPMGARLDDFQRQLDADAIAVLECKPPEGQSLQLRLLYSPKLDAMAVAEALDVGKEAMVKLGLTPVGVTMMSKPGTSMVQLFDAGGADRPKLEYITIRDVPGVDYVLSRDKVTSIEAVLAELTGPITVSDDQDIAPATQVPVIHNVPDETGSPQLQPIRTLHPAGGLDGDSDGDQSMGTFDTVTKAESQALLRSTPDRPTGFAATPQQQPVITALQQAATKWTPDNPTLAASIAHVASKCQASWSEQEKQGFATLPDHVAAVELIVTALPADDEGSITMATSLVATAVAHDARFSQADEADNVNRYVQALMKQGFVANEGEYRATLHELVEAAEVQNRRQAKAEARQATMQAAQIACNHVRTKWAPEDEATIGAVEAVLQALNGPWPEQSWTTLGRKQLLYSACTEIITHAPAEVEGMRDLIRAMMSKAIRYIAKHTTTKFATFGGKWAAQAHRQGFVKDSDHCRSELEKIFDQQRTQSN